METKHTPGPWEITGVMDETWVAAKAASDGGDIICQSPMPDCPASLKRWPANARLIAAAPDLLAALRLAAEWCEHNGCGTGKTAEMPWLEDALAAIARAKGES